MAMKIMVDGKLNPKLADEPRFAQAQLEVMLKVGKVNPNAVVVGLDQKLRPVIETTNPSRRKVRYALMRNGEAHLPITPMQETF